MSRFALTENEAGVYDQGKPISSMVQHVLVPVDHSDPAVEALRYALETFPDGSITALHVINPPDVLVGAHAQGTGLGLAEDFEQAEAAAETLLEEMEAVAAEAGATIETVLLRGQVERRISQFADENDPDLIVIGSHGRDGFDRVVLGSVAEKVVRRAPVPVLVVR